MTSIDLRALVRRVAADAGDFAADPDRDIFEFGIDSLSLGRIILSIEDLIGREFDESDLHMDHWRNLNCMRATLARYRVVLEYTPSRNAPANDGR